MRAVDSLGYAPNSVAKNLRTLRSGKLLVTVPDIANPFFALILQGIEDTALREGYSVLLGDTQHDEQREERYATMLKRKEADGLIFLGHRLPASAAMLVRAARGATPLAPIVNGCEFNPELGVPSVHIDNTRAASDAMEHLYALGHTRIGVVTGPLVSPLSRDRLQGATSRARARQAEREMIVMHGDFSIESGTIAGERLLTRRERPTAIFCFNDEMPRKSKIRPPCGNTRGGRRLSVAGNPAPAGDGSLSRSGNHEFHHLCFAAFRKRRRMALADRVGEWQRGGTGSYANGL
jgi:LacI family repressor for deo operon, udp, cdd, tsx, nupC, and nupG